MKFVPVVCVRITSSSKYWSRIALGTWGQNAILVRRCPFVGHPFSATATHVCSESAVVNFWRSHATQQGSSRKCPRIGRCVCLNWKLRKSRLADCRALLTFLWCLAVRWRRYIYVCTLWYAYNHINLHTKFPSRSPLKGDLWSALCSTAAWHQVDRLPTQQPLSPGAPGSALEKRHASSKSMTDLAWLTIAPTFVWVQAPAVISYDISLSLSVYIYIYIYIHLISAFPPPWQLLSIGDRKSC